MIQSKINVLNAIAGYMGVPKKAFVQQARDGDNETGMMRIPEVPQLSPYHFYCSPLVVRGVGEMFTYAKFVKCQLWEHWHMGTYHLDPKYESQIIMAFKLKSILMTLYRGESYTGVGGLFVRQEDSYARGWCCEPIVNWLVNRVPRLCLD